MLPDLLETDRLTLRPFRATDARAAFERWACDPAVTRFLAWSTHERIEQAEAFMAQAATRRAEGREVTWAVCLSGDGDPWGSICARLGGHVVELGYALAKAQWGRGLMTEAASAVRDAVFAHTEAWRFEAHCAAENAPSARVLEKIGMSLEGRLRRRALLPNLGPEPVDLLIYGMTREDYAVARGASPGG